MKNAILFPGQGSQSKAMLSELYDSFDEVKTVFKTAAEVLNFDLYDLIQNDELKLNQTINTQPAMLAVGYACYKVLKSKTNINPICLTGHSLGEYTALVAAGYIDFDKAIALVRKRGELMQSAVKNSQGAMAAILGLNDDVVIKLCAENNDNDAGIAEAANFNSPNQVVISGNKDAVNKVCNMAKDNGAKMAVMLPVSVPSHSSLMKDAAKEFALEIKKTEFKMGNIAVMHNVDTSISKNVDKIKEKLIKQLYSPVLWTQTIKKLTSELKINTMIECGPGRVLTGLNRRINRRLNTLMVFDNNSLNKTIEGIQNA